MTLFQSELDQAIMEILAVKWPLRTKEIAAALQTKGLNRSYAHVRKHIIGLVDSGILSRQGIGFALSLQWLAQMRAFAEAAQEGYHGRPTVDGVEKIDSSAELWFGNIRELDRFFLALTNSMERKLPENVPICWHYRRDWWPVLYGQGKYELTSASATKRFYYLCEGDSPIDRWCCDVERRMGLNVKQAAGNAKCDTAIFGDMIFQIYLPEDFISSIAKLYRAQRIEQVDFDSLLKLVRQPRRIRVVVVKNSEFASILRDNILKHFRKTSK